MMAEEEMELEAPLRASPVSIVSAGGRLFKSQPSVSRAYLTLTREKLECRDEQPEAGPRLVRELLLEDLVGVDVSRLPPSYNKAACQISVHVYPKTGKKNSRRMTTLNVCFDDKGTHDENEREASKWKQEIKLHSYHRLRQVLHNIDSTDTDAPSEVPRRHLLVLINPVCGQGKAEQEFREHVQPLFDRAEISYDVVVTERQNHARELMRDFNFSSVDGIVIASGDGLLYEVMNGIMEREDWEQVLKTPIGMLPTGSGNALCASTLYEAGEECNLVTATFQIIQGGVIPMDIATVETADKQTLYMTLLSGWGMIADIDIESEKLRRIGESRFVFGALNCILKKRIYRGRLVYLPCNDSEDIASPLARTRSLPAESTRPSHSAGTASAEIVSSNLKPEVLAQAMSRQEGGDTVGTPGEDPLLATSEENKQERSDENKQEGTEDVFEEKDMLLEEQRIDPLTRGAGGEGAEGVLEVERNQVEKDDGTSVMTAQTSEAASPLSPVPIDEPASATLRNFTSSGPKPDLLPELNEATPDHWKVIEGEFLAISPIMIPLLSSNFFGDPRMSIGTGRIRILYIQRMSRFGMLGLLTSAEKGTHIERPDVHTIDVKAFRLEPYTEEGIMTVDGEVVKYGPMQAQVHQHLARVFCRKRVSQDTQTK